MGDDKDADDSCCNSLCDAFLAQFLLIRIVALLSGAVPNLLSILGPCGFTFFHVAIYGWIILLYFLKPLAPWVNVDGQTDLGDNANQFYCTIVRLLSAVFFETSGFFTVVSLELVWYSAQWEAPIYFLFQGDTFFNRSASVKEFLTAKDSAQMQLSIGTLLNRVCDATVELNHEGIVTSPAPQLAALLMRSGRLAEQQISTGPFVQLVEESKRKPFADHLISVNKELLLKQGDKSLPTAQLKLNLLDASR